jgi:uncharacterized peroxidase-related enzyme
MSHQFPSLTVDSAPTAARGMLAASQQKFGFLPSPVARGAHAPGVLKHLLASFAAYDQTSLSPLEREIVAMTVAFENGCHYCMAMHTALQAGEAQAAAIVAALRTGASLPDAKLDALRAYARALVLGRGHVAPAIADAFAAAGYSQAQALEVVLGVSVYTLSTFLNIVTDAPLDAPFTAFAWERPTS